jgi:fatty acid desaturase
LYVQSAKVHIGTKKERWGIFLMTDYLKTYGEVFAEHKKDSIITFIFFVVVLFLAASGFELGPSWYYNLVFALLAAFLLMLACVHFQRYSV